MVSILGIRSLSKLFEIRLQRIVIQEPHPCLRTSLSEVDRSDFILSNKAIQDAPLHPEDLNGFGHTDKFGLQRKLALRPQFRGAQWLVIVVIRVHRATMGLEYRSRKRSILQVELL